MQASHLNLAGVTLGNPTFRWGVEGDTLAHAPESCEAIKKLRMDMLGGHGQFSPRLYKQIQTTCRFYTNDTVQPSSECAALLETMKQQVGGYDLYNIYDQCKLAGDDLLYDGDLGQSPNFPTSTISPEDATLESLGLGDGSAPVGLAPHDDRGGQCGEERALASWANEAEVRAALHVLSAEELGPYAGSTHLSYVKNEYDTYSIYAQLLAAGKRVLVYSGDVDNCLPWTGTLQWVEQLSANVKASPVQPWRPWTLSGGARMGGYVVEFGTDLTFATVRGAGA